MLGMSLMLTARDRGYDVTGLYRATPISVPDTTALQLDLTDFQATRELLFGLRPDLILHSAAEIRVDWCEDHASEAKRVNVDATAHLAETAFALGARLLYVSTDSVFDGSSGYYRESDPVAPPNVYARTKLEGERAVLDRLPSSTVARVTFYGWGGNHKSGMIDWILRELEQGKSLPGFADAVFCPILVNHLAEALLELAEHNVAGTFHAVGSESINKYEFAKRVAEKFGFNPDLVRRASLNDAAFKAARPRNCSLNIDKLTNLLGRNMPAVDEGLDRYAELRSGGYQAALDSYFLGVMQ